VKADGLLAALDLPLSTHINLRVPKKLLLENGAPTAADKRQIADGIEEIIWLAALKPTTIGVPEYRDSEREILEIAVLRMTLRTGAKEARLIELVHRAVPYPVLLLTEQPTKAGLSVAAKRWAQNEAGKTVLDGDVVVIELNAGQESELQTAFQKALALDRQPRTTLQTLYQGWINALLALKAAQVTGEFRLAASHGQAETRQKALGECSRLEAEITRLRSAAEKEKQLSKRVELNLKVKELEILMRDEVERLSVG